VQTIVYGDVESLVLAIPLRDGRGLLFDEGGGRFGGGKCRGNKVAQVVRDWLSVAPKLVIS
jgi:hypothetical protein